MALWQSSLCREWMKVGCLSRELASASSATGLLQLECTSNEIGLIAYPADFVAQAGEAKRIDGAIISLQVVSAAEHRFAGSDKLIRHRDTIQPAIERIRFAGNETWQKSKRQVLITRREVSRSCTCVDNFFTNYEVAVEPITINKLGLSATGIGLDNDAPCW